MPSNHRKSKNQNKHNGESFSDNRIDFQDHHCSVSVSCCWLWISVMNTEY
jgi:hypothetical protein